jgi:A/G-specific adenine glycosylase
MNLQTRLRRWFRANRRDLPWRLEPRDPYHVWLSEVMLQQTQVATVIPYFERWLLRFPTLRDFAEAPLDDVLKLWEGLGYYARARNFHKAAQTVMREHGGQMPDTVEGLLTLPGVGPYTAGAVASLAFGRRAALLDGNVKRVLGRITADDNQSAKPDYWAIAESKLPRQNAGEYNEALMELGALVCTPRNPACSICPVQSDCAAWALGAPEAFPARAPKKATPHRDVISLVIRDQSGRLLLGQRPAAGLLGGLWEFVGDYSADLTPEAAIAVAQRRTGLSVSAAAALGTVKHAFTHFKITRHVFVMRGQGRLTADADYADLRWLMPDDIRALALTRSDQKIAERWVWALDSASTR